MALTGNSTLVAGSKFYIDDYMKRNTRTLLKNLKNDSGKISEEDLLLMIKHEKDMKNRYRVVDALNELIEDGESKLVKEKEDVITTGFKPVDEIVKEPEVTGKCEYATWKDGNVLNGLTWLGKTFLRNRPVKVNADEKKKLQDKYGKFFFFDKK